MYIKNTSKSLGTVHTESGIMVIFSSCGASDTCSCCVALSGKRMGLTMPGVLPQWSSPRWGQQGAWFPPVSCKGSP